MNFPPLPPPEQLIRMTYDNQVDVNWLWENRKAKKLQDAVIQHFFSPNIPPMVRARLKKKYKLELLKVRRLAGNIRNLRRRRMRRRMTLAEVLDDDVNVSGILSIINTYIL